MFRQAFLMSSGIMVLFILPQPDAELVPLEEALPEHMRQYSLPPVDAGISSLGTGRLPPGCLARISPQVRHKFLIRAPSCLWHAIPPSPGTWQSIKAAQRLCFPSHTAQSKLQNAAATSSRLSSVLQIQTHIQQHCLLLRLTLALVCGSAQPGSLHMASAPTSSAPGKSAMTKGGATHSSSSAASAS